MTIAGGESSSRTSGARPQPTWRSNAPVLDDVHDLRDREAELVVRREEVRAEADPCAGRKSPRIARASSSA